MEDGNMSFSFLGSLASLLPGYLQGQRQANQDNWQDLMNYNQVQRGQLSNLWTLATWQPNLNMTYENALSNNLQTWSNVLDFQQKAMSQPMELGTRYGWSSLVPEYMYNDPMAYIKMGQMGGLRGAVSGAGGTPSNIMR